VQISQCCDCDLLKLTQEPIIKVSATLILVKECKKSDKKEVKIDEIILRANVIVGKKSS
jgi:hypothetical protein